MHLAVAVGLPVSGQKNIQDGADAPDSEWLYAELSVRKELNGPVRWSSSSGGVANAFAAGASKVDQTDFERFRVDKNVLILDVSMTDASVRKLQTTSNQLTDDDGSCFFVYRAMFSGKLEEVNEAVELLHNENEGGAPFVPVKRADNCA